ncbi:wyosine base formation domain-containing protein [Lentzea aerocolonigenes]|uniref:Wyosine base formation domain-containing protein n=1 Tax=Lentzea aerocolonigenes TaxID=68170 RepID=A0A0F0GH46_LENAE|nr:TIGR03084 family metal-binding protein [Lentzea aerocolonigenes]KJK40822.1 wyosine base formation domain-containing protein [Lentzea aerocolonigenes]
MITELLADLDAESRELDALVAGASDWTLPTPAEGWTIGHQIGHLMWTDKAAILAITDPESFKAQPLAGDIVDRTAAEAAALPNLLELWRDSRAVLRERLATASGKILWFGPPMSPASMATARIMETWAHGQDVYDALGVEREPTARIRHVCHIGVRAMGFAFLLNGLAVPEAEVRVELTGPSGEVWAWGPEGAENRVTGPALDFAWLVTQRRNRKELAIDAVGEVAEQWVPIAQAFAGPPGGGR